MPPRPSHRFRLWLYVTKAGKEFNLLSCSSAVCRPDAEWGQMHYGVAFICQNSWKILDKFHSHVGNSTPKWKGLLNATKRGKTEINFTKNTKDHFLLGILTAQHSCFSTSPDSQQGQNLSKISHYFGNKKDEKIYWIKKHWNYFSLNKSNIIFELDSNSTL